jgi:hypothetical protein
LSSIKSRPVISLAHDGRVLDRRMPAETRARAALTEGSLREGWKNQAIATARLTR